jgi:hypothetical protein
MLIPTGNREVRPCRECGASLEHREGDAHTHPDDGSTPKIVKIWRCDRHTAPCGLPCFSGGVPGNVYGSGQYHRRDRCPGCNPRGEQ